MIRLSLCVIQTESSVAVSRMVREKVLDKLVTMGDPQTELLHLFAEIDANNSQSLKYVCQSVCRH